MNTDMKQKIQSPTSKLTNKQQAQELAKSEQQIGQVTQASDKIQNQNINITNNSQQFNSNHFDGFPQSFQIEEVSSIQNDYNSQNFMTNQVSPDKLNKILKQNEAPNKNILSPRLKTQEGKESSRLNTQNSQKEAKNSQPAIGSQASTIENKLKKSLELVQKEKLQLQENLIQANDQQTTYKIEIFNLKKQINKLEQQVKGLNVVISQLNDTIKEKEDSFKKQNTYVKQLENQILKGSNSKNSIDIHKKNEEKIEQLKKKNDELMKELLQFKNQDIINSKEIEFLKTSLEQQQQQSQQTEQAEESNVKQDFMEELIELKQELKRMKSDKEKFMLELEDCEAINQSLYKANEALQIQLQNLKMEAEQYQEALDKVQQDNKILMSEKDQFLQRHEGLMDENQQIKKLIETNSQQKEEDLQRIRELNKYIDEINEQFQNRQEQWLLEQQNYENQIISYTKYQEEKDDQLNQLRNLIERMQKEFQDKYQEVSLKYVKMQKINTKLFEMLDMCEGLLDENFEKALEETLGSMQSKKQMKKDITQIVESCAKNLAHNNNNQSNNNLHNIMIKNILTQKRGAKRTLSHTIPFSQECRTLEKVNTFCNIIGNYEQGLREKVLVSDSPTTNYQQSCYKERLDSIYTQLSSPRCRLNTQLTNNNNYTEEKEILTKTADQNNLQNQANAIFYSSNRKNETLSTSQKQLCELFENLGVAEEKMKREIDSHLTEETQNLEYFICNNENMIQYVLIGVLSIFKEKNVEIEICLNQQSLYKSLKILIKPCVKMTLSKKLTYFQPEALYSLDDIYDIKSSDDPCSFSQLSEKMFQRLNEICLLLGPNKIRNEPDLIEVEFFAEQNKINIQKQQQI